MSREIDSLAEEIGAAVAASLGTDLALLAGYSRAKAAAIAAFTVTLGRAHAAGALEGEALASEMAELDRMVARFVRNIRALAVTTAERLLRAVGSVLIAALDRALAPAGRTLAALAAPATGLVTFAALASG